MTTMGSGKGDANDAAIEAIDGDPEDHHRKLQGEADAALVYAAEAEDQLRRYRLRLERAEAEVAACRQLVAEAEAEIEATATRVANTAAALAEFTVD